MAARMNRLPKRLLILALLIVLFLAVLIVLFLAARSPTLLETDSMLPPGFEEAHLPDGDFNAYLYISHSAPIAMPLEAFGDSASASEQPDVELSSLGAWVGPNLDSFGARVEFQQQVHSQAAEMVLADDVEKWREGGVLWLVRGEVAWADGIETAMRAGDGVTFKHKYEDMWKLLRLLPEEPPLEPAAAGFIRADGDLLDPLTSKASLDLGGLGQAMGTINVKDIAYVAYAEDELRLPEDVDREFVKDSGIAAVFVARSTYPGFILGFFLNTFADRVDLQSDTRIAGEDVLSRDLDGVHLLVKPVGSTIFIVVASEEDISKKLMESVLQKHLEG